MRFLCDEMLKRLGQWLRVAGHDVTIMPDGTPDALILQRAEEEDRWLLSSDRRLAAHRLARGRLVLLDCQGIDACAHELGRRLDIDWLYRPFTRCMACNTPLRDATPREMQDVPAGVRAQVCNVRFCPSCRQLYWNGSHVDDMRRRLQQWNARRQGPA